jgi:MFS family permease
MLTIAAVATNVCALPVGTILDYYGPRISATIGSVLLATGALFLSFAAQLPFDGYIPGYLFLALGGPFVFISSFQLSNAFPNHSGLILALLNGAFDSSSAVFLAYRLLYTASNGAFTPKKFFLIHLIIPVFILVVQVLIMPKESYKNVGELVAEVEADNAHPENATPSPPLTTDREREERRLRHESAISETTSLLGTKSSNQPQPKRHEQEKKKKKQQTSSFQGVLHGRPALEQIRSPWFILITLFTTVQVTRINYFVATIRPQYAYLLHSYAAAEAVNNLLDIALPLGGLLSIPFVGLVLDHTSTPFVLALLVTLATAIGILGLLPYLWAAYANVAFFVLYRPLYYTAVS